ncbi:ThiF family adenylyltransferase [candidate division KSB1 bacterium]|nr:ThiF family adenylyltransferase [candidate division KSB1 bacterium]
MIYKNSFTKRYSRIEKYRSPGQWIAVIGVGNIGGELCRQLIPLGFNLILIDNGYVDVENLGNQFFFEQDLGRPKVTARTDILRRINSGAHVLPVHADIAAVGAGLFAKCRLIFTCLDSWYTRTRVNTITRQLNIPLVDTGISNGGSGFGRVTLLDMRQKNGPCLFCSWDRNRVITVRQKENEQKESCGKRNRLELGAKQITTGSTNQPGFNGSLVAAVAAAKGLDMIYNQPTPGTSQEIIIDLQYNILKSYSIVRSQECVFPHQSWPVKTIGNPGKTTVQQLFDIAVSDLGTKHVTLSLFDKNFVSDICCENGHNQKDVFRVLETFPESQKKCACGAEFAASPLGTFNSFDLRQAIAFKGKTWAQTGLPKHDIVTASNGREKIHYII